MKKRKKKEKPAPVRDPVGHPYARISDPEQRQGGGLVRQTEDEETKAKIAEFCRLFGFKQSKLIRVDDGVSAWKGLNATPEHELGQFIAEAKKGLIPPGDCLILENYDRLSRQDPWAAIGLVNDLRQLGIHVGRLDKMKLLRCDSTDYGDFFEAAIEFMRGNSESNTKSYRNGSEWRRKREAAREKGDTITHRLPAWVQVVDGKRVEIKERADVVRYIFHLAGTGHGLYAIVQRLTNEKVPAFGERVVRKGRKRSAFSGRWTIGYVHLILTDRRALGECQPLDGEGNPDGDVIPDYFPQVVTEEEFQCARAGARERYRRPGKVTANVNVFQGLLRDARTGAAYGIHKDPNKGKPYPRLQSRAPRTAAGNAFSFSFTTFEVEVLRRLREIKPAAILNGDGAPDETEALGKKLAAVEGELAEAKAFMDAHGFSPTIGERIVALENQQRSIVAELATAREAAAHPLSETWGECQTLIDALATARDPKEARLRLRSMLRRICAEMWLLVVPRGRDRLCVVQMFFVGGERCRRYLILHRRPVANAKVRTEGFSGCWSFSDVMKSDDLDLRRREDVAALEKKLLALDLETLTAKKKEQASV
jgi:hypothetical protein